MSDFLLLLAKKADGIWRMYNHWEVAQRIQSVIHGKALCITKIASFIFFKAGNLYLHYLISTNEYESPDTFALKHAPVSHEIAYVSSFVIEPESDSIENETI